ncbi:MAG: acyltransferase family protein, partial [Limisphaerales bacterium]
SITTLDCGDDLRNNIVMGVYRLLLAYAVVLSHIGLTFHGLNLGIVAVISFLLLSGYVMTGLIQRNYLSTGSVPFFYVDRLIRLGPQFYFYLTLTLVGTAFGLRHAWLLGVPSQWHSLLQFLIVPTNFYRHFNDELLLPQTWSLGLEATFYAVFPFILIWNLRVPVALVSFVIFVIAYAGIIDTDLYGYRYLPGTLFIFICGSWLKNYENQTIQKLPLALWLSCAALLALTYIAPIPSFPNREVLTGIFIGIPAVYALTLINSKNRIDSLAGDLSYGVFLNHVLIIAILETFTQIKITTMMDAFTICIVATMFSYTSFKFLEEPLIKWRHSFRSPKYAIKAEIYLTHSR